MPDLERRLIAVGDIHGCAKSFDALLEAIAVRPDDTLVLLGDYVDRGPATRAVLERILAIRGECRLVPLIGNHEIMMITAYQDYSQAYSWLQSGGQTTIDSYGGSPADVPSSHLAFLEECVPYFESDAHFFIHANYDPVRPLEDQPDDLRYWLHLHAHRPGPHMSGKIAVVGHTPQRMGEPLDVGHLLCLDTYCFGGGWLTAFDVSSRACWQANEQGFVRSRRGGSAAWEARS